MANTITIDTSEFDSNIRQFNATMQAQLGVVGSTISRNMQTYAKANHPWTNRTYSAQNKLKGEYKLTDNDLDISIAHGVDYGYYLETRADFDGRYKILEEARDSEVNNFKGMIRNLF
jgi:hypothetical protein|nr:MAG TPA: type I neck protein [Caudoviricetes sp.]